MRACVCACIYVCALDVLELQEPIYMAYIWRGQLFLRVLVL